MWNNQNQSIRASIAKRTILILSIISLQNAEADMTPLEENTASEIRREVLLPPMSDQGNPLPLAAHWNSGEFPNTFDPQYQFRLIAQGHHLLPWFHLDIPGQKSSIRIKNYYVPAIKKAEELNIPISFVTTQWERLLSDDNKYFKLPSNKNPNLVKDDGSIDRKVSPMGPVSYWNEVGSKWTNTTILKSLQTIYPSPPLVLFVSNNEHQKLRWDEANKDKRFSEKYGATTEKETKEIFANEWISRYRALQQGMKDGLVTPGWQSASKFIGYSAFGPSAMGRWPNWTKYTLDTDDYISPWPLAWDGASPPFYTHDWDPSTDNNVWGPMIGAQNWVPMKEEAFKLNPDFWFEISIWDGQQPSKVTDKRKFYELTGQAYSPARYGGMVKYAMWLLKPRIVREFRNPKQTLDSTEPYFMQIVNAVDALYRNPILTKFWRKGSLVFNLNSQHPYNSNLKAKYAEKQRWFLLNTNYDAKKPWNVNTIVPVFCIALQLGELPNREWLLYSFSPLGMHDDVQVDIPNYKKVSINSNNSGTYFHIKENADSIDVIQ